MFCLVCNNSVIIGPIYWSKTLFETVLQDELGVNCRNLPEANCELIPVILSEHIKILPVKNIQKPIYNDKIQQLAGPYYSITDNDISYSYLIVDRDIESVKHELIAKIAESRWKAEISGIWINIQTNNILVSTKREDRDMYMQMVLRGVVDIVWKFGSIWLTLSREDLQLIDSLIHEHIQRTFRWELETITNVKNCKTLDDLDKIKLEYVVD